MSEQKKMSDILREEIDNLRKEVAELKKPAAQSTTSTELVNLHTHTPKEMFDCPTCGDPYLKEAETRLRPKIEKDQREKIKSMKEPVICEDCGEVVEKTAEECPSCHGRKARKL